VLGEGLGRVDHVTARRSKCRARDSQRVAVDDEADDVWDVAADDEDDAACVAEVGAAELVVAACDDGAALVVAARLPDAALGWYSPPEGPKRRFELLTKLYPRVMQFVTEFGAQSFPNRESACKFLDAAVSKIDWNNLVESTHFQPNIMSVWYDWKRAKSLDELIAMSQDYQIEINQYYIDRLRLHKHGPCGGFAPFMFLDSNPAVQWSIIDYWREPKQSYFHMQVALNPEYVFTLLDKDQYKIGATIDAPIYVVNDSLWDYADVSVRAELLDPNDKSVWQSDEMKTPLEPDCAAKLVKRVSFTASLAGDHRLVLTLQYGEQSLTNEYRVKVV